MKSLIIAILSLLLITSCSKSYNYKAIQVDYIENDTLHSILLNVKQTRSDSFEVISQENFEECSFIIQTIFDYD